MGNPRSGQWGSYFSVVLFVDQGCGERMRWKPFRIQGEVYHLAHLHPHTFRFERSAEGGKPSEIYLVDTVFTSHCFTRKPKKAESYDEKLVYIDGYENRLFDFRR